MRGIKSYAMVLCVRFPPYPCLALDSTFTFLPL